MVPWQTLVTLNHFSLSLTYDFEVKKRVTTSQGPKDGDIGWGLRNCFNFFLHLLSCFLFYLFIILLFFLSDCLVLSPKLGNFVLVELCNMGCCLGGNFSSISPLWTTHLCVEQLLSSFIGANLSLYCHG